MEMVSPERMRGPSDRCQTAQDICGSPKESEVKLASAVRPAKHNLSSISGWFSPVIGTVGCAFTPITPPGVDPTLLKEPLEADQRK
jgi:hypothetical protein